MSAGFVRPAVHRTQWDGEEVHAAMEDLTMFVDERVYHVVAPLVAAIEARFDVQDAKFDAQNAKIDAQSEKIESLTEAVRDLTAAVVDLTKAVAATNAKVESVLAKVAAQDARIGALQWMFGIVIGLFLALAAVGLFSHLFPPPNLASGSAGPAQQATSAAPPEPPKEADSVTPVPAPAPLEPTEDGDEPAGRAAP